ncbi:MAG: RES family NAD+ phosphorylase [Gammaproteobacteria bacterium]|nr:RES family NAD+ phosphorylase [Gammaproteobacteria bacterium]
MPPLTDLHWDRGVRIIRSIHPPIDLFEDIADPADWPLLVAAEQKTNPRLMASIGNLDLVPVEQRVAGPGASWLMAPFTHVSRDRPSRFTAGDRGVLYAGDRFEVALFETIHHHARFMRATDEPAGWTSAFRELHLVVRGALHDLRVDPVSWREVLDPDDYAAAQALAIRLRTAGSEGVVYPSVRCPDGQCAGLFRPDRASRPRQGRHLHYHWNGERVDLYRDAGSGSVYRIS